MTNEQLDSTFVAVAFASVALGLLVVLYAIPHTVKMQKLFRRAKKPSWAALVPLYNTYLQGQVIKKPTLALAVNGLLVALFVVSYFALVASVETQAWLVIASLVVLVVLFGAYEKLDHHFMKHFKQSK